MKLLSFDGGFGRLHDGSVIPMGSDIVDYLRDQPAIERAPLQLSTLSVRAPVPRPGKIVCIGLNYRDHAAESGQELPAEPVLFAKFSNSVIGPGDAIVLPDATKQVDYEAELGVVIGRKAHRVTREEARSCIAGFTCVNDVSARDLQSVTVANG